MMKSTLMKVRAVQGKKYNFPRIRIYGEWLLDIGFEGKKSYWIEHNTEHVLLRLDDGTMQLKAHNKPYVSPRSVAIRFYSGRGWEPYIELAGQWLFEVGFEIGKQALIQYEHGVIIAKPLFVENASVVRVTVQTTKPPFKPKIRLTGAILDTYGFTINKMALHEQEYGHISLRLRGEGQADYLTLAKSILKNRKGSIVYVKSAVAFSTKRLMPIIEITDKWLTAQGFVVHATILVTWEQGAIDIRLMDSDDATKRATPE